MKTVFPTTTIFMNMVVKMMNIECYEYLLGYCLKHDM